jgi:hypothetical protein
VGTGTRPFRAGFGLDPFASRWVAYQAHGQSTEPSPAMQQQDVERILRDVLSSKSLRVSILRVARAPNGWRATVTDVADRVITIDLPDGPPDVIRAMLTRWIGTAC